MPTFIFALKVSAIFSLVLVCTYLARREKKPLKLHPEATHPLDWYDADFIQLAYMIDKAKTFYELGLVREEITSFRGRFIAYKEPAQFQIDIKKLRRKYKAQRNTVSIRSQLFSQN